MSFWPSVRRLRFSVALLPLTLPLAQPAAAQDEPSAPSQSERTGPQAQPPRLPDFASPGPESPLREPGDDAAPATLPFAGPIREVRITADPVQGAPLPPDEWLPPSDPASGLQLAHRPGEPLDDAWVRRQFSGAAVSGDGLPASAAVALVQLVNRAFLTAGFINSGLLMSGQEGLSRGILELHLVYGRLAAPNADGDAVAVEFADGRTAGLSAGYVRRRFPSAGQRPLNALGVERDFRLLTEDPAIGTVNSRLRAGDRPGEAQLVVTIDPERRHDLYLTAANDRSPSVGGARAAAGGYVRNLVAGGDLLTGEIGTTEGALDAQLAYATPFLSPRTTLSVRGSLNNAAVIQASLLPLDISSRDRSVQAGLSHRFIAEPLMPTGEPGRWSPSRSLSAGLLVTHRRQKSFLFGEPFSFSPGSVDGRSHYSALRLTGDYIVRNVDQVLAVAVTASVGLGGTQSEDPAILNPDETFKTLVVQLNYARRLTGDGLELRSRLTGQIADTILYSGERLSIGGTQSVRGYRESLFLVDQGLIGSIELAQPFNLSGENRAARGFDWGAFAVSAFTDAAWFGNVEPPQPGRSWVGGVGLSLAWTPSDAIQARATYAHALKAVRLPGDQSLQDRGFYFAITVYPMRWFSRR